LVHSKARVAILWGLHLGLWINNAHASHLGVALMKNSKPLRKKPLEVQASRFAIVAFPLLLFVLLLQSVATAQTVQAPYDAFYTAFDLGAVPGVPTRYGGV